MIFRMKMSKNTMSLVTFLVVFVLIASAHVDAIEWLKTPDTLISSHVIFRHGARTPDKYCFKLFNITKDYWPYGTGQLTQKGKMEEYRIGATLRERYDKFLGDVYYPNLITARSTDYDRTKASLLLCLAGLFPPTASQKWNDHLLWQPIPIQYKEVEHDMLMRYPSICANFHSAYQNHINSPRVQMIIQAKQNLIDYIRNNLEDYTSVGFGFPTSSPIEELFYTYFCLVAMDDTDVPIPLWSKPIYPDILSQMAVLEYHLKAIEDDLIQYSGGYFWRKILNDTENYIAGEKMEDARKLYLYSGHEYNVALTLLAIDSFPPKVPNYGSFVVIEHHKKYGEHGFQIFYQNYEEEYPLLMTIPGCTSFCSLKDFKYIMATRMAPNNLKCD